MGGRSCATAHGCSFDGMPRTRASASSRSGHGAPIFISDLHGMYRCCEYAGVLRHVAGFPGLGLLRPLRPLPPASAGDEPSHRSARSGPRWGRWEGSHVPCFTVRQGRCPTMPLRYRHGYAAGLRRGLPAGDINRRGSFQHHSGAGAHRNPAPIRQVRAGGALEGRLTLVPCVHLPVPLAGPGPSDGAGLSRLCQGCLPPSPASPGIRLPSATSARCGGLKAVAFHHHTVQQRLVALDVATPNLIGPAGGEPFEQVGIGGQTPG